MLSRVRLAVEAGRKALEDAQKASASSGNVAQPVIALLVLDPAEQTAERLERRHLHAAERMDAQALFVLNPLSAPELARNELLCEFLPLAEDLAQTTGDRADVIERYLCTRLRLILDKWNVRECRWEGESASELVEAFELGISASVRPVDFSPAP